MSANSERAAAAAIDTAVARTSSAAARSAAAIRSLVAGGFCSFSIGLFGLDKLADVAGAVARLDAALDQLVPAEQRASAA